MPRQDALRLCSRGRAVVYLQILLRSAGYELEPDGLFGSMTREAVKTFQAMHGIRADGVVDGDTWDALEGVMPMQSK